MLNKRDHVQVKKIDERENPEVKSDDWESHVEGRSNPGKSLPVDYTARGYLMSDLQKGYSMSVERYQRNGKTVAGVLTTSPVAEISPLENGEVLVKTQNSKYIVEMI